MRSVVRQGSVRCARCHLPPRWCICAAQQDIVTPLAVDIVMHHREGYRPSSTGHLINRLVAGSRNHLWRRERELKMEEVRRAGRELWILHPQGAPAPTDVSPADVQVVLLDGSWRETIAMAQDLRGSGRLVSLPMTGTSRFWLRAQSDAGRFSTAEALMFVFLQFGLNAAHDALRAQLELHVYAHFRARGQKIAAEEFLAQSAARAVFADLIGEMNLQRPRSADE